MTSTEHRPPLRAAYSPQHDDRARWQRERRRFAAFLTARDIVLGYARTATEGAGRLAARLHLDGLCTMVRRSYGWLLGAASVAARGLRAPGLGSPACRSTRPRSRPSSHIGGRLGCSRC